MIFEQKMNFWGMLKFTIPSMFMMLVMSLYSMVDGLFVSNLIGTNALSAINLAFPVINLIFGFAVMFATGGSAVVMKKMGEQRQKEALGDFSFIVVVAAVIGIVITVISLLCAPQIIQWLGATKKLEKDAQDYLFYSAIFFLPTVLATILEQFMISAGNSKLAFGCTLLGGVINVVLDYVLIAVVPLGIKGAAIATGLGYLVPAVIGIWYFMSPQRSLYFLSPSRNWKALIKAMTNGSSEMFTNLANGIVTFLFNINMLHYLGEDGIAAITIVLYAQFFLTAISLGYSMGVSPMISYQYGAQNQTQLSKIIRYSMLFMIITSILTLMLSMTSADLLVGVFAKKNTAVFELALSGFQIYGISFLFMGTNIFISGMFTAFSNGKISALLSILRTLILVVIGMIILPKFLGVNGIWAVVPVAECLSMVLSIAMLMYYRSRYGYQLGRAKLVKDGEKYHMVCKNQD